MLHIICIGYYLPTYKWKSIWNNGISIGVSSLKIKTSTLNSSRSRSERASWRGSTLLEWRHRYSNLPYFLFFLQRPNRKSKSQYSKSVLCFKSIHQIFSKADPYQPTQNWANKHKSNPKLNRPKTGPTLNWTVQSAPIKTNLHFLDFFASSELFIIWMI